MRPAVSMFDGLSLPVGCRTKASGVLRFLSREVDHGRRNLRFLADPPGSMLTVRIDSGIDTKIDHRACAQLFAVAIRARTASIARSASHGVLDVLEQVEMDALYWLHHYAPTRPFVDSPSPTIPLDGTIQCEAAGDKAELYIEDDSLRVVTRKGVCNVSFTVVPGTFFQFAFLVGRFVLKNASEGSDAYNTVSASLSQGLRQIDSFVPLAPALIAEIKLRKGPFQACGVTIQNANPNATVPNSSEVEASLSAMGKLTEAHVLLFTRLASTRLSEGLEPLWPGHDGLLFSQ